MEIVIDIDDYVYKKLMNKTICVADIVDAIKNGTPLPVHHGRIIDESQISRIEFHTERELYGDKIRYVKVTDAPTIIDGSDMNDKYL